VLLGLPSSVRSRLVLITVLGLVGCLLGFVPASTANTFSGTFAGAYKVFTTDADFNAGTRDGVISSSGALKISTPAGTRSYLGKA